MKADILNDINYMNWNNIQFVLIITKIFGFQVVKFIVDWVNPFLWFRVSPKMINSFYCICFYTKMGINCFGWVD